MYSRSTSASTNRSQKPLLLEPAEVPTMFLLLDVCLVEAPGNGGSPLMELRCLRLGPPGVTSAVGMLLARAYCFPVSAINAH